jgi:hypothetical protein
MHILEAALVTNLAQPALQRRPEPIRRWPRPGHLACIATAAAALLPLALLLPIPL